LRLPALLTRLPSRLKELSQGAFRHRRPRFWFGAGIGVALSGGAIALGAGAYYLERGLPDSVDDVLTYAPPGTITIKAADGRILQEIGPATHEKLKMWQIPDRVSKAFIASEDRRFQEHQGVDFLGIARAVVANLQARGVVEGGSTITQQLARITFLNQERNVGRKFKEMRLAKKIEENFEKEQILERYLNLVYLGSGAYGVADAAWVYFSKPVGELTLAEAATLAGIVPAPSVYSPIGNPKAAKERRNQVLRKMQAQGLITAQEAEAAIASPLEVKQSKLKRLERQAPYFTEYIQKELPKYVSSEALKAGGIVVETTLNPRWQKHAEETIEKTVERYGKWQRFEQAAIVAIDPRNGQIKAMVGGTDFGKNEFNRVTQAKRQPGSTFKTFVYTTAIAAGFSPNRRFPDAEYVVDGYKPENYGDKYSGAQVSMRSAISGSLNVVAVRVLVEVGWNPIIKVAQKMGIESKLYPTYSLALGASEVNLLELTSAYGTLANRGFHQHPYGISRILDRRGKVIYQANFKAEEALDPDTTAIVTWMLRGVVDGGTGVAAQIGRPVAGKTGTSDKARDLWFVGYIPQLVTGVWLGNDNNQATWGQSSTAAATWRQFMLEAAEDISIESFPDLPGRIDGRKGTIKAEPLKPRRSHYNYTTATNPDGERVSAVGEASVPRRRRRLRRNRSTATYARPERRVYRPRRSRSGYSRRVAPSRVNRAPEPAPAPAPAPRPTAAPAAPAPASTFTPPAPPASRKEE
jgi:penicillin-binding protein 1A